MLKDSVLIANKIPTNPLERRTIISQKNRRTYISALLGNLFEHYDTALYGLLAPFLAPYFFPHQDPITALLMAYALIPLGMIARPLGALVLGYIGDKLGRTTALSYSLFGMALTSLAMAFCPTFEQAGILSPIFLTLTRIISNFLSAGESMGGAIYVLENSPEKKHDWLSGLYNASTMGGIVLASLGVTVLCSLSIVETSWRYLFVMGSITALYGFYLRRSSNEEVLLKRDTYNILLVLKKHWIPFTQIFFASGFSYATYSIAFLLSNGLVPLITSHSAAEMAHMNFALLIIDLITLPLFGYLAGKWGREKIMLGASLFILLSSVPLFSLLSGAGLITIFLIRLVVVLSGVAFAAPFHAWAQDKIESPYRYQLISLAYALGSQIIGGPTAAVSLWIYKNTGTPIFASLYWMVIALPVSAMLIRNLYKRLLNPSSV